MANGGKAANTLAIGRKWALILGGVAVAFTALVQPLIGAFKGTINIATGGSTLNTGTVINMPATFTDFYGAAWANGWRVLTGATPAPASMPASRVAPVDPASSPSLPRQVSAESAIGYLARNVSLLQDATWSLGPYQEPRLLQFKVVAEAFQEDLQKLGTLHVTISREGANICTLSLNTASSNRRSQKPNVITANASCPDQVAAGARYTYRAKVVASDMKATVLEFETAYATKL